MLDELVADGDLPFPPIMFLSDALKVKATWPELIHADMDKLPYENCQVIANCSLPQATRMHFEPMPSAIS